MSSKFRGTLFAILGVVLIGTGLFAVYELVRRTRSESTQQEAQPVIVMTQVVIAAHDISLGDLLTPDDVLQVEVPAEAVPPNTLTRVEDAINRFINVDLVTGEMIMAHNLADPTNVNHDLAFMLGENYVLMAFPATDLMSKQNVIQRGDIVDILATMPIEIVDVDTGQSTEKQYTFDALQHTGVTAMVWKVPEDNSKNSSVTNLETAGGTSETRPPAEVQSYLLAIRPQDALVIKYLKDVESVFDLVLRDPSSLADFELDSVTSEYIMDMFGLNVCPHINDCPQ